MIVQANSIDSDNINLIQIRRQLVLLLLILQGPLWFYTLQIIVHLAKVVLGRDLVSGFCGKV